MGFSKPCRFLWNRFVPTVFLSKLQFYFIFYWQVVSVHLAFGQAVNLADSLKHFPQKCMQADRQSAYYSTYSSKSMEDALEFEFQNGIPIIETV